MRQALRSSISIILVAMGLSTAFIPDQIKEAIATTQTVIGWNVPNPTTLGNGIVALMLPLVMTALFVVIPVYLKVKGNIIVTLALMGFTAGSLFGMLSTSGSAVVNPLTIPFAQTLISAVLLVVWIWKGAE